MTAKISELTQSQNISGGDSFEVSQIIGGSFTSRIVSAGKIRRYVLEDYAKLSDVKAYNVDGGTFTQDAWRTRDLNTEYDPENIVTLSANQFTLQAGTYRIHASAPSFKVTRNVSRLYNISDSSEVILGTSEYSLNASDFSAVRSHIFGEFTITAAKTFEIQHYCTATQATNGFGLGSNVSGISSIFTVIEIWKVN